MLRKIRIFITLHNVCAVHWGECSTLGDVQYTRGYHEYHEYTRGYHEYSGGFYEYTGGIEYTRIS